MPFIQDITQFINDTLKAGSLNKEKLQPAMFYGLATTVHRSTKGSKDTNKLEQIAAIITAEGKATPITPDDKYALQVYHKLLAKNYSYEKKSYGDGHDIKCSSELQMVIITNSKLTGKAKELLEPVVLFGLPQKLSTALFAELKISKCLISPVSSNMDHMQVFKQEYPQSAYFLNEQMSMFSIRYKIELTYSQSCVDACFCE